eukprot:scaffold7381_cov310-Pinguiococcus_pyrenoidosus.AAC.37
MSSSSGSSKAPSVMLIPLVSFLQGYSPELAKLRSRTALLVTPRDRCWVGSAKLQKKKKKRRGEKRHSTTLGRTGAIRVSFSIRSAVGSAEIRRSSLPLRSDRARMLLYAVVARGTTVLAEHEEARGNVAPVTRLVLSRLPEKEGRLSYVYDEQVAYHVLNDQGITFLCVAECAAQRRLPFLFLEDLRGRFWDTCGEEGAAAKAYELDQTFAPIMRARMRAWSGDLPDADGLTSTRAKLEAAKSVMVENIDNLLERGEKIQLLVEKSEELRSQGDLFWYQSRKLRCALVRHRYVYCSLGLVVVLLIIYFLLAMSCGGLGLQRCTKS